MAEEVHKVGSSKSGNNIKETAAGCASGSTYKYLDINNVRTLCYSYGNGWFLENAEYEIPKGSKKTSMFSFSLWIGGIDINNNLKLAAYRYGQGTGIPSHVKNDYWPGPLTVDGTAAIDAETCAEYDKLYPMSRAEVQEFLAWWDNKAEYPNYVIPKTILEWPAHGKKSKGQAYYLAPFMDVSGEGDYDPKMGDYPYYDLANRLCPAYLKPGERIARAKIKNGGVSDTMGILVDQVLKGDQTLWSVYNDKGNYHSETTGEPIGMEIRAQYFAFATNDEINNMTFYSYEIINRSTYTLTGTYFSQWVDPDLGYANDDYVGCDVNRGLGYCYNGTPIDGTGQSYAYGSNPPAVGVDFFQGPYMDPDSCDNPSFKGSNLKGPSFKGSCDIVGLNGTLYKMGFGPGGLDSAKFRVRSEAINGVNFGDGIIDNERFGMRRFVYHNNSNAGVPPYMTDPQYAPEYYLFLRGIWKDNAPMIYGGNAHFSAGGVGPECDFMFPGLTDVCDWGTRGQPPNGPKEWTEVTAKNNPQDRRFMQSAGPFTLLPGACNYITVGIPWAQSVEGTPAASVLLLKQYDDKAQSLFDNCFAVLNGPNAPDLVIEEMSNSLIFYLSNRKTNDGGNNYQEKYKEYDPNIPNPDGLIPRNDSLYHFEGYQIFQLKDATVSAGDLDETSKARLVAQFDIQNGVKKLVNWTLDANIGGNVGKVMVDGADKGIQHSFVFSKDMFATGDERLINHKQYYYIAVAYAYNEYKKYNQTDPMAIDGQKKTYLRGRSNIKVYTAIPHIPLGVVSNSSYGEGPVITRIQGQGNGGMILEFSQATIDSILIKPPFVYDSTKPEFGPDYPICYNPTYLVSKGPLQVKVIDPLNVIGGDFTVKFDSMVEVKVDNPFAIGVTTADTKKILFGKWSLTNNKTGKVYLADTTTIYHYEQTFLDLGLALTINQVPNAGDSMRGELPADNGLLYSSPPIYEDSTLAWFAGVEDSDIPESPLNWIRSGTYKGSDSRYYDWNMASGGPAGQPWDPNKNFQKIQTGTWAPYCLTAIAGSELPQGPALNSFSKKWAKLDKLGSVNIVMTPDKKLWTRCPIIELCPTKNLAQGNAVQFDFRNAPSVNINGDTGVVNKSDSTLNSNYINAIGMGWFPGYAINLETGERLNVMFGENSWLVADNGRDMIWNPSSRTYDDSGIPVFGGQHYLYIMGHTSISVSSSIKITYPAYDGGAFLRSHLMLAPATLNKWPAYGSAMYVNVPLSIEGKEWLNNAVTTKIRISKPYERYYSTPLPAGSSDTVNRNYPMYVFNTNSISTSTNNVTKATSDLDYINVVPNPYYAYDDYERNQLDNRIKLVNLPTKCVVTIFDMSGTMIRQFVVDKSGIPQPRSSIAGINTDAKTSVDWDLKNFAGIPISGGVYLIHVKADGLGERVIKWFGILRPVDLNSL
ncbi:MAG: T9SS C-terminal target domain-containing protein [Bacteroidota bacterium]